MRTVHICMKCDLKTRHTIIDRLVTIEVSKHTTDTLADAIQVVFNPALGTGVIHVPLNQENVNYPS